MDYGHTAKTAMSTPDDIEGKAFFTAGVGDAPEALSPLEPENDLNAENWSSEDLSAHHESALTPGEAANHAQNRPESRLVSDEDIKAALVQGAAESERLGVVTTLSAPTATAEAPQFDPEAIRADGDRISRGTLREVEKAVSDFDKGKISLFQLYDNVREMNVDYLNNTYGDAVSAAKDLKSAPKPPQSVSQGRAT